MTKNKTEVVQGHQVDKSTTLQSYESISLTRKQRYTVFVSSVDFKRKIINSSLFQVMTPSEYKSIIDCFPYSSPSLEDSPFPKQFPFSAMVVRVYTEVKEFILSCVKFSEDLNLSQVHKRLLLLSVLQLSLVTCTLKIVSYKSFLVMSLFISFWSLFGEK